MQNNRGRKNWNKRGSLTILRVPSKACLDTEEGRTLKLIRRFNLISANRACQFGLAGLLGVNIYLNATLLSRLRRLVLLQTQHVCLSGFLKYEIDFP